MSTEALPPQTPPPPVGSPVTGSRELRGSVSNRMSVLAHWPDAETPEAHIRSERVRAIYQQAPPAQFLSVLTSCVVAFVVWGDTEPTRLIIWVSLITVLTAIRMTLTVRFQRTDPPAADMPAWETGFIATLAAVSLTWGVGGLLIMPHGSPLLEATVYFFLMGVAAGAVAVYSAHPTASALAILSVMAPPTVAFAFSETFELRAMAMGGLLYLAAALRSTRSFGYFLHKTFELSYELRSAYGWAKEQARTDELTGLPNRRAFMEAARAALDQAARYERDLTIAMIDIDHFKTINDEHGHATGDQTLSAIASVLTRQARTADTPGRLGGEEFAIILPETSAERARIVAERIRHEINRLAISQNGAVIKPTCSIGLATRSQELGDLDDVLRAADEALYQAKAEGRNRVVSFK